MKIRLMVLSVAATLLVLGLFALKAEWPVQSSQTFSNATIKQGSSGKDVLELQGRLKFLGYYDGNVDGSFGAKTLNAVTWFQWKFGLKSDGIVSAATKEKLWEATKNWSPGAGDTTGGKNSSGAGSANAGAGKGSDDGSDLGKSNKMNLSANDLENHG